MSHFFRLGVPNSNALGLVRRHHRQKSNVTWPGLAEQMGFCGFCWFRSGTRFGWNSCLGCLHNNWTSKRSVRRFWRPTNTNVRPFYANGCLGWIYFIVWLFGLQCRISGTLGSQDITFIDFKSDWHYRHWLKVNVLIQGLLKIWTKHSKKLQEMKCNFSVGFTQVSDCSIIDRHRRVFSEIVERKYWVLVIIITRARLRWAAGESNAINRVRFYIDRALGYFS